MRFTWAIFAWLAITLVGCEAAKDAAQSVQQTAEDVSKSVSKSVEEATTNVQESMNLAGQSELQLDAPVKTAACYAYFTPGAAGGQSVLALQSYKTVEKEQFPALYIQANVAATKLGDLAGQTVPAAVFVKASADGPTWTAAPGQTVQLKISKVEGSRVTAELIGAPLTPSNGGAPLNASGTITAVVP